MKRTRKRLNFPENCLSTTKQIRQEREDTAESQNWICPVSGEQLINPSLDHCHDTGVIRGVLSGFCNTWEGQLRTYYKRFLSKFTDKPLPELLRNMADYLEEDFTGSPYHFRFALDYKNKLMRKNLSDLKDECSKLGLDTQGCRTKGDYSVVLTQDFINKNMR
jgi:hypothetical protein